MTADTEKFEEDNLTAAEYVLRVLSPREERAFEDRIAEDRALEAQVAQWVERLTPISDEIEPVKPGRKSKAKLMNALFAEATPKTSVWDQLGLWRALSFVGLGAAAVMAVMLLLPPLGGDVSQPGSTSDSIFVSEIASEGDSLRILAAYDPNVGTLQITRTAGEAFDGRVLELWAIEGDNAPVSLGVLAAGQKDRVNVPEELRPNIRNLILAVSDEPPGGSPTGAPTGAVLAVGPVTEL